MKRSERILKDIEALQDEKCDMDTFNKGMIDIQNLIA